MNSLAITLFLGGSTEPVLVHAAELHVSITDYAFLPKKMVVHSGDVVVWTNRDVVAHSVSTLDNQFDSGVLDPGQSAHFTFKKNGNYPYRCGVHPYMLGSIKVSSAN